MEIVYRKIGSRTRNSAILTIKESDQKILLNITDRFGNNKETRKKLKLLFEDLKVVMKKHGHYIVKEKIYSNS